jgi:hypothetical protein
MASLPNFLPIFNVGKEVGFRPVILSSLLLPEVFDEDNSKSLSLKEFKRACRIYGFRGHLTLS